MVHADTKTQPTETDTVPGAERSEMLTVKQWCETANQGAELCFNIAGIYIPNKNTYFRTVWKYEAQYDRWLDDYLVVEVKTYSNRIRDYGNCLFGYDLTVIESENKLFTECRKLGLKISELTYIYDEMAEIVKMLSDENSLPKTCKNCVHKTVGKFGLGFKCMKNLSPLDDTKENCEAFEKEV